MAIGSQKLVPSGSVTTTDNLEAESVPFLEGRKVEQENLDKQGLINWITDRFTRSKDARRSEEERWLKNYRDFSGRYDTPYTDTEKSKAFIKITKTKVMAAAAQINEVLFAGNRFPIGVEPTPVPEGVADSVHMSTDPNGAPTQDTGGVTATIARPDIAELVGPLKKTLDPVMDKIEEGPGLLPSTVTWEPAKIAARKMEKKFYDQLTEAHAEKSLRNLVFELCLFGTGVYKGPFVTTKDYPKWTSDGTYEPITKVVADFSHVSVWDSYPDPEGRFSEDMEYFIHRHRMSKSQLRALKKRPHFRSKSIDLVIEAGYSYERQYWENELEDFDVEPSNERFEVLEFWGNIDKKTAEEAGLKIPEKFEDMDEVQINAWTCNGYLLRLVFNPFTPVRIPYYICPYEVSPYSIFGVGVAENMSDAQTIMNGFMRMTIDNAALSSNVIFEIDETMLAPGQDLKMYPGKVIRRQPGASQNALSAVKIPNVTNECLMIFDKARQLADESTGIPSYSHGQAGVQGVGRTASGMSMLMGAAAQNIKAVVRNIDDYLITPLGKSLYAFNMQFDFDENLVGDLEIISRGTESLMRNEIRSQKILQFMQLTNNPVDAPWVKRDYLLRELSESLDLEAEKTVNDPRAAAIQALLIQEMQRAQGIVPGGEAGGPPPNPADPSGGTGGNPSAMPSPNDPTQAGVPPEPGAQGNTQPGIMPQ